MEALRNVLAYKRLKGTDHLLDTDVDGKIAFKWSESISRQQGWREMTHMAQDGD
jgi:hypothetical protein